MKTWIKFYTEALHDRKMRKLDRVDKSIFYDLLLLAGQEDKDGELPSLEDIALELDLKVSEAKKAIDRLLTTGIISKTVDNVLCVTEFTKRQMSHLSEAEKKANYRKNLRTKSGHVSTECPPNEVDKSRTNVQKMSTLEEEVEEEEDIEVEEEKEKNKKEKSDAEASHTHSPKKDRGELKPYGVAQNVMLSDKEYNQLWEKFGQNTNEMIDDLSVYMGKSTKNAKKYTNHYYTILSWSRMKAKENETTEDRWDKAAKRVEAELNNDSFWGLLGNLNNSDDGDVIDL